MVPKHEQVFLIFLLTANLKNSHILLGCAINTHKNVSFKMFLSSPSPSTHTLTQKTAGLGNLQEKKPKQLISQASENTPISWSRRKFATIYHQKLHLGSNLLMCIPISGSHSSTLPDN